VVSRYIDRPGETLTIETRDIVDVIDGRKSRYGYGLYAVCPRCKRLFLDVKGPNGVVCVHTDSLGRRYRFKAPTVHAAIRRLPFA
jgi:hypothetical protein